MTTNIFLAIVDDHSRFFWIFLMHSKAETQTHLKNFIVMVERQFDIKVKMIRSDNGSEFILRQFYDEIGIIHQTSCVETPQQNGIVERKHQHLLNVTRSLLFQSNLPFICWSYALIHFGILVNCIPTTFLGNKTPYEKLYGTPYDISSLRVFGCLCFTSSLTANKKKLDLRVAISIFLGFKPNTKGYVTLDLKTKAISISRNVIFL